MHTRSLAREATKEIHKYVETLPIMSDIIKGTVNRENYTQYLVDLQHIYRALENHSFFDPAWNVQRCDAIQRDLEELGSGSDSGPSCPTVSYCKYISCLTDK